MPSLMWVDLIQASKDLNRTKSLSKRKLLLPDCWAGTLIFSCTYTGTYTVGSPDSQNFRWGLKLHHWVSPLSSCCVQILGLLCLCNYMSQLLIINLFLSLSILYIYIYICVYEYKIIYVNTIYNAVVYKCNIYLI